MHNENFDLAGWKKQGEDALAVLRETEVELTEKLQAVRSEMDGLEKVLGINAMGKKSRIRIRPAIVEVLNGSAEAREITKVVDEVKKKLPLGTKLSIEKAVRRFMAETPEFTLGEDNVILRNVPEKVNDIPLEI